MDIGIDVSLETGRAGRDANEGIADLWRIADRLNEEYPGAGEWVPWRAVDSTTRRDILPREADDFALVRQYASVFDQLPAITVQRDTFILIDGLHRLKAAAAAGRDHIRIVEVDVPDEELWLHALKANTSHGKALTLEERRRGALRLIAERPDWSDARIAQWSGVSERSVWEYRDRAKRQEIEQAEAEGRPPQFAEVAPVQRVGVDGRVTTPRPASPPRRPAPKPIGRSGAKQLALDWIEALDRAFEDAPDAELIEPEWAMRAAEQMREAERRLRKAADEARALADRYHERGMEGASD